MVSIPFAAKGIGCSYIFFVRIHVNYSGSSGYGRKYVYVKHILPCSSDDGKVKYSLRSVTASMENGVSRTRATAPSQSRSSPKHLTPSSTPNEPPSVVAQQGVSRSLHQCSLTRTHSQPEHRCSGFPISGSWMISHTNSNRGTSKS